LEDEDFLDVSILLFDEKHGSQNHDDIGTFFLVRRRRWDIDCCFFLGDPIYDIDNKNVMA
jgi:hypothetical protein